MELITIAYLNEKWHYVDTYMPRELVSAFKAIGLDAFTMPEYLKEQAL